MSRGHQQQADAPMAILWDMENCPVPSEVKADDVATNVRRALRQQHQVMHGAVTYFAAYGDFTRFTRKVREGCQRTGVNLIDVPNGKKDASDKAILVDMFLFALDNRPPCTLFLISGDVDFSSALHKLGQRGYTVVLAVPSRVGVSPALLSAGRFVWDWPSLARGVLQVAKHNSFSRPSSRGVGDVRLPEGVAPGERDGRIPDILDMHSISSFAPSDESDFTANDTANEEEIVWKTTSTSSPYEDHTVSITGSYKLDRPRKGSFSPRRISSPGPATRRALKGSPNRRMSNVSPAPTRISNRSPAVRSSLPGKPPQDFLVARELGKMTASSRSMSPCPAARRPQAEAANLAADGSQNSAAAGPFPTEDFQHLKEQVMKLLSYNRGEMEVSRLPGEYFKAFGEHLPDCGPNCMRLLASLEKSPEWFAITGEGHTMVLCLTKSGGRAAGKLNKDTRNSRNMSVGVAAPESGFRSTPPLPEPQADEEDLILLQHEAVEAQNGDLIQLQSEDLVEAHKDDLVQAKVRNLADPADELEGEEVVLGRRTQSVHQAASVERQAQSIHAWSVELQSLKVQSSSHTATISREVSEAPEEKEAESHDNWEVESVRLMIDDNDEVEEEDHDEDALEEKDLECDESTLKEVVKLRGNKTGSAWSILDTFKVELQDLLVCHAGRIQLSDFWKMYWQRYSRVLDFVKFDVDDLEALIGKVGDVATVREVKGIKMLVIVGLNSKGV